MEPGKVKTVYNGLDVDRYRQDENLSAKRQVLEQFNIPLGSDLLGIVSTLLPRKRHGDLLEAMTYIREQCPTVHLLIVGFGPLRDTLERRCRELKIEEVVHFLGYQDRVAPIMAALDIVVLPSVSEGMPMALLDLNQARFM